MRGKGNAGNVFPRITELIFEGKSNTAIWKIIKEEFDLEERKNFYPRLQRGILRRKGQLPPHLYASRTTPIIKIED